MPKTFGELPPEKVEDAEETFAQLIKNIEDDLPELPEDAPLDEVRAMLAFVTDRLVPKLAAFIAKAEAVPVPMAAIAPLVPVSMLNPFDSINASTEATIPPANGPLPDQGPPPIDVNMGDQGLNPSDLGPTSDDPPTRQEVATMNSRLAWVETFLSQAFPGGDGRPVFKTLKETALLS